MLSKSLFFVALFYAFPNFVYIVIVYIKVHPEVSIYIYLQR